MRAISQEEPGRTLFLPPALLRPLRLPRITEVVLSTITQLRIPSRQVVASVSPQDIVCGQENSCQVLQCPEDQNMTTLVPETNCKYYSMYPVLFPPVNATMECIPKAGMFLFSSEILNYTEARNFCQKRNASLAHVISEERTEGLGKLMSQNFSRFIGLSSERNERIWKNEFGEPLSCFDYRAWGEEQPSHSKGCVALTNPSAKSSPPFWKVMPCHALLPFICEISPLSRETSKRRYGNHT
ncbi:hypothetical protein ALC53_06673 [Atta colombica]|uniref:C-type lectin domain-containing protein n=1 Tax=Atta colombica TaxID=520822 RepID=A0A195BEE9_9HYME|nr:hypothetical protein ALC53_06673 [Atta colombica]